MKNNKENLQQDLPDTQGVPTGQADTTGFTIVGIGASAGALKACEGFFTNLPPDSGAAFVIVIHLDPSRASIFVELLQKYTRMKVFEAADGMVVAPNCVYVIPPKSDISIQHGALRVLEPSMPRSTHLAIDFFFRSLAEDQGENAVCIILSGTGKDGTLGLQTVKAELGLVMVQEPATAEFDGMPRNASDTGLADYVLPVEEMPAQLLAYMNGSHQKKSGSVPAARDSRRESFNDVLEILRIRTGHDFSLYKKGTVERRIERRMNVTQIAGITEYVRLLHDDPGETQILFRELLINVTSFFRDPEVFTTLKETVLPQMLSVKLEYYPVRVWVPGCASGEEVYSLAIILRECLDALRREFNVQIFGTDIDEEAIAKARRGAYPFNISSDISPERLNSFFNMENETYKIRKDIREAAVFATHDVAKDTPFAKLDLISCRNLLIYLEAPLQKKLLSLFHNLLQPDGILLLGNAETLGELADYFTVVDQKCKLFKRKEVSGLPPITGAYPIISSNSLARQRASSFILPEVGRPTISQVLEKELLEKYAPPSVVINDKAEIVYVHGRTGKYFELAPGQPPWSVFDAAREGLKYELKSAIQQATAGQVEVVHENVLVVSEGSAELVNLTVRPITGSRSLEGLLLVMFEGQARDETPRPVSAVDEHVSLLEQELSQARQLLKATTKGMEASYQEAASTNEELLSTNEELQSSNEELETSKEEMQSLYEELVTVNSELRINIDDLSRANSDLNNFLNSTEIAAIFLDSELNIRRFTPLATQMFKLLPVDVGRPLEHIVSNLVRENVVEDVREVLSTLSLFHKEVETKQGIWHMMRVLPYRNENNVVGGAVITFTDINEQKTALAQVEQKIAEAMEFNQKLLESSPFGMITYGSSGQALYANNSGADILGGTREQILQQNFSDLESWKQTGLLDAVKRVLSTGTPEHLEVHDRNASGKQSWWDFRLSRFISGGEPHLLLVYDDITERKEAEETLRHSEERFSRVFHSNPCQMTIVSLVDHRYIDVNQQWLDTVGFSREEVIGKRFDEVGVVPEHQFQKILQTLEEHDQAQNREFVYFNRKGEERYGLRSSDIITINGEQCLLGAVIDITERKKYEKELTRLDRLNLMGEIAAGIAHEIRTPMTVVKGYLQILQPKVELTAYKKRFDTMIVEVDRANAIITEFLSLAKDAPPNLKQQRINTILTSLLPLIQADAAEYGIVINLTLSDTPEINLDERQIRQLVLNLVRNGIEAMTKHGEITVKTRIKGNKVVLSVKDQGSGIPPDTLKKLGKLFFTTKEKGTGLGLSVCNRIVENHHARIEIKTGKSGTTVMVSFPIPERLALE